MDYLSQFSSLLYHIVIMSNINSVNSAQCNCYFRPDKRPGKSHWHWTEKMVFISFASLIAWRMRYSFEYVEKTENLYPSSKLLQRIHF